jgi:hypothetical protein
MSMDTRNVERAVAAIVFWASAMTIGIQPSQASAAEAAGSVEAGHEVFEQGRYPWYDAEHDKLQPLTLPPSPAKRDPLQFDGGFLRYLAWGILAAALVALVAFIVYAVRNRTRRPVDSKQATAPAGRPAVESLPFMADRSRGDLLGEARRYYQQGNYSEAIIYLFSYQLVELDRFALIRLAKGKTNRQYLRELGKSPPLRPPLELTMTAFEDVFFGRRALDRAGFEACWSQLPLFEQLVAQSGT